MTLHAHPQHNMENQAAALEDQPNDQFRLHGPPKPPTSTSILQSSAANNIRLTTPRLTVRSLATTDLQASYRVRSQHAVMAWQTQARPDQNVDETRAWLAKRTTWPAFMCGIELRDSGDGGGGDGEANFIGVVGCHTLEPVATCGFLLSEEFWGKGLMTEALGAWLELWWARTEERAQCAPGQLEQSALRSELFAFCNAENESSRRVLMKCGFRAVGVERKFESERWIEVETWCISPPSSTR